MRLALYLDAHAWGGAEIAADNLLAALPPRIAVTIVGIDEGIVGRLASTRPGSATVVLPPITNKADVRAIAAHVRAVRRLRPDVLQVNLRHPWSCQYGLLAGVLTRGTRVVAVQHLPIPASSTVQKALVGRLYRAVDAHVAVGTRTAREIEAVAGLPDGMVRTIYNAVPDAPSVTPTRAGTGHVIGSLGRLDRQKGYDVLARALPALPDVTAVVIGKGVEEQRLRRIADEEGVAERFVLTGHLEDARSHLASFDVFVMPSRNEGLPLAIVEAMLAEIPVVATTVGSIDEAVTPGVTGLLVPPDDVRAFVDAVHTLLVDPDLRRQMGSAGRATALERFGAARVAEEFGALYDSLLAGSQFDAGVARS